MKKTLHIILTVLAALLLMPAASSAQTGSAKITTRKARLADFTTKTTKVVLAGSEMFNNALQEEISRRWLISPHEFCTLKEYEALKEDPSYYFLLPASSKTRKEAEAGILVLALEKGGKRNIEDASKEGLDVVSIPCASAEFPSGREYVFLPALIDIIQGFVSAAMLDDRVAYGGLATYASKILNDTDLKIVFSEDDLASAGEWSEAFGDRNMNVMDEDEVDEAFGRSDPNTVVSYVVSPTDPGKGAVCYKMLIKADTHELCYFSHHRISSSNPAGFLNKDLRIISLPRKIK